MKTVKIIIGRNDGTIERGIVRVRDGYSVINAITRYGSAMQDAYHDVAGISHGRGVCWTGHSGNPHRDCPEMDKWTDMTRQDEDNVTWNTL
jgi:transposase